VVNNKYRWSIIRGYGVEVIIIIKHQDGQEVVIEVVISMRMAMTGGGRPICSTIQY